jgi:hypothetical protein
MLIKKAKNTDLFLEREGSYEELGESDKISNGVERFLIRIYACERN